MGGRGLSRSPDSTELSPRLPGQLCVLLWGVCSLADFNCLPVGMGSLTRALRVSHVSQPLAPQNPLLNPCPLSPDPQAAATQRFRGIHEPAASSPGGVGGGG